MAVLQRVMSEAEYLAWEAEQEERNEFYDGEIVAMAGAKPDHNRIVHNFSVAIDNALGERPCETFLNEQRVRAAQDYSYLYPDVVVTCGGSVFDERGNLLNPLVVFEILSPSTESRDRRVKRELYQSIPSLQEYVLVSQEQALVEVYRRQESGVWEESVVVGLGASLRLESLDVFLSLERIYKWVEFPQN